MANANTNQIMYENTVWLYRAICLSGWPLIIHITSNTNVTSSMIKSGADGVFMYQIKWKGQASHPKELVIVKIFQA